MHLAAPQMHIDCRGGVVVDGSEYDNMCGVRGEGEGYSAGVLAEGCVG